MSPDPAAPMPPDPADSAASQASGTGPAGAPAPSAPAPDPAASMPSDQTEPSASAASAGVPAHASPASDPSQAVAPSLQDRVQRIARRPSSRWAYRAARRTVLVTLYPYLRVQRQGAEHLDAEGPLIVAPVHRSNLDAPLVSVAGRRPMRFLAKQSLFDNRWFGGLVAALGAFPVRRGGADREALRVAAEILDAGQKLLVFPEGGRGSGPKVQGVFDGVSWLAAKTGASVVPVGVAGTEAAMPTGARFPRRVPVAIVVGPPVPPPEAPPEARRVSRRDRSRYSQTLADRLQSAFDQAQSLIADR